MMNHTLTAIAVASAFAVNFVWYEWQQRSLEALPVSDWFDVKKIDVANTKKGDDPIVIYDRVIKKPFNGTWIVEVVRVSDNFTYCSGNGQNYYEPKDKLPEVGVTLAWMIGGKKCDLVEGQYMIEAHWEVSPDGIPTKPIRAVSNVFEVK